MRLHLVDGLVDYLIFYCNEFLRIGTLMSGFISMMVVVVVGEWWLVMW